MLGCVSRQEALPWWGDVCVPDVGEDISGTVGRVLYDPCTELVGGTLQTKGDVWPI